MLYHTPYWLRKLGGNGLTWDMAGKGNLLYLTFDDGPDPDTTPAILKILEQFGVKAPKKHTKKSSYYDIIFKLCYGLCYILPQKIVAPIKDTT